MGFCRNRQYPRPGRANIPLLVAFSAVCIFATAGSVLAARDASLLRISAARSTVDTGIVDTLAQRFERIHPDIRIEISSVGALTAIKHAKQGKADLIITHHPPAENHLVAEGFGILDTQFMRGNYVVFGPPERAVDFATKKDIVDVLTLLAQEEAAFLVPAPLSGTYRKIESLWALAGIDPKWFGYENTESSGIATLIRASQEAAFTIADMSTYNKRRDRLRQHIVPIFQGSMILRNPYSAIVVNPAKIPGANDRAARKFLEFLVTEEIQDFINNFGVSTYGAQLFHASAHLDDGLRARRNADEASSRRNRFLVILGLLTLFALSLAAALLMTRRTLVAERHERESVRLSKALQIDRDKAIAASSIKSAFLSRMSHELRTPLNAIIGYSEMLEENAQESKHEHTLQDLKNITASGKHLLHLVNDILDLSKIEAGKESLHPEEIQISQLFQEVELLTIPLANNKKNELLFRSPDRPCYFNSDILKLRQILFNLIANACKFTTRGQITVTAKQHSEDDGEWLILSVADTGIGISEEKLPRIFEEFAQAEDTTARDYGGTGLGLAICKKLVGLLGGAIEVQSKENHGTTFTINLPIGLAQNNYVSAVASLK